MNFTGYVYKFTLRLALAFFVLLSLIFVYLIAQGVPPCLASLVYGAGAPPLAREIVTRAELSTAAALWLLIACAAWLLRLALHRKLGRWGYSSVIVVVIFSILSDGPILRWSIKQACVSNGDYAAIPMQPFDKRTMDPAIKSLKQLKGRNYSSPVSGALLLGFDTEGKEEASSFSLRILASRWWRFVGRYWPAPVYDPLNSGVGCYFIKTDKQE